MAERLRELARRRRRAGLAVLRRRRAMLAVPFLARLERFAARARALAIAANFLRAASCFREARFFVLRFRRRGGFANQNAIVFPPG